MGYGIPKFDNRVVLRGRSGQSVACSLLYNRMRKIKDKVVITLRDTEFSLGYHRSCTQRCGQDWSLAYP